MSRTDFCRTMASGAVVASLLTGCGPRYIQLGDSSRPAYTREAGKNLRQQTIGGKEIDLSRLKTHADKWLGTPYLWGGEGNGGIDCSAFTQNVWKTGFDFNLPRTAALQSSVGIRVFKYGIMPGDLVFFGETESAIDHVGIYMGNNEFINATSSEGVKYSNLDETFWRGKYQFAKRLVY